MINKHSGGRHSSIVALAIMQLGKLKQVKKKTKPKTPACYCNAPSNANKTSLSLLGGLWLLPV